MFRTRAARLSTLAALALGVAFGSSAAAQDATPEGLGGPPLPAGCEVFADGLLAPRFMAVAADGTVYITETGTGGDEVLGATTQQAEETDIATPVAEGDAGAGEEASPVAEGEGEGEGEGGPPTNRGYTGQVTVVTPDGTQGVLSTSFASYSDGVGPEGITIGPDGLIYMAVGGAGVGAGADAITGENTVFVIDPATGQPTVLAELGSLEVANNPDGTDVNPNLYDVAFGTDGLLYVADAGGNTIYSVDPATGAASLFTVVPELGDLTGATPEAGAPDRQAVPTGLALATDGNLLVGLLSEGWPADGPSILSLAADGTFTSVAEGLSVVVDVTVGPDGAIYATQLTTGFGPEGPAPGNVLRIGADGSTEVVVDGLFLPHGIAFDGAGNLYVTTGAIFLGPGAPGGQVLRCAVGGGDAEATPVAAAAVLEA